MFKVLLILAFCLFWGIVVYRFNIIPKKNKPDPLIIDFNKAKYNLAYKNKLKAVKAKISELESTNIRKVLNEQIVTDIIVQMAIMEVERDRKNGKIDELYLTK